ncbi:phage distal tail protein domain-containing protein [Lactococcus raffinolactis]|uniref:phage distal tail protein domain-containing protein n=1 Tax=Pseudolactococcus raffinolactis TaxID=1366 RepID=UPI00289D4046|nr:phage distal tail protein domain-containing protein [Lactococcus raffinolactis]
MIRKISILNEKGDLLDFSDREKFLLYDVSGLGVEFDNKVDIFNASVLMNSQNLKLGQLKAKLLVGQNSVNGYEIFSEMFRFLNSPPYTVIYETDTGVFYRDCVLNKLTKSDMKKGRVFIEDIIFDFLTPFYKEISETYKPNSDTEGDGKIYYSNDKKAFNLALNSSFQKGQNNSEGNWMPDNWIADWYTGSVDYPPKILNSESDKPDLKVLRIRNNHTSSNKPVVYIETDHFGEKTTNERYSLKLDLKMSDTRDIDSTIFGFKYNFNDKIYQKEFTSRDFGLTEDSLADNWHTCSISFSTIGLLMSMSFQNAINSTSSYVDIYVRGVMLIKGSIEELPTEFYEGRKSSNYHVYPFVYEGDYNGKFGIFQIENNSLYIGSAKGSPVEITVHGPCTNPYWEILDGSKVLQSDGYNIDVPDGYKLVVSSVVQKQRVKLIAPDGTISDVYQQQDLSKSNFVTIPEGRVTLAFHNVGDVSFNYREEYITV